MPISKHLMLKFINEPDEQRYYRTEFQNILCWSLSAVTVPRLATIAHFKTSYVEVYRFSVLPIFSRDSISKHLMLKFIHIVRWIDFRWLNFKTSYVEVYLLRLFCPVCSCVFQNILCWSLSNLPFFANRTSFHFKTSYVEVYPGWICWKMVRYHISKHLMLKFIALSHTVCHSIWPISKHLMLKFI